MVLTINVDDDDQFKEGDDWEWEKKNVPIHQGDDIDTSLCVKNKTIYLTDHQPPYVFGEFHVSVAIFLFNLNEKYTVTDHCRTNLRN